MKIIKLSNLLITDFREQAVRYGGAEYGKKY